MKETKFNIDFFEFSVLVEACIPPRPIARSMFWTSVIDKYYHIMTPNERAKLYEWIGRNSSYQDSIERENESCLLFEARFNPDNQYEVTTELDGDIKTHNTFRWQDRYHISSTVSLIEEYITKVNKINI